MSNTHGQPDTLKEIQAIGGDLLPACLLTSPGVTAPGSGLTITAASCTAYARSGVDLVYIDQPAVSVTVPNVAGSHWLIAHRDTYSAVASWTRRAGSHFLTQQAATQPTIPDACVLVAQLTVAGGNLTAVDTTPALSPPLSRQTADAVAITDGRISLGGHAPTGVLDVSGSVNAGGGFYPGARLWPVAPSGATAVHALAVEAATGAGLAGAQLVGYVCANQPTMAVVRAIDLNISSGANRYNVYALGTAQNYLAGNVGIANPTPSYPLDVTGQVRMTDFVAFGANMSPFTAARVHMEFPKATRGALSFRPTDNDTGGAATVLFQNFAAATTVGSIAQTATATAYNTSSDVRLKRKIEKLVGSLDIMRALNPISHLWNTDDSYAENFLAHELQQVLPYAVTGEPDAVHPDGSVNPQQVDLSKCVPRLVGAVKELLAQVEALTARVGTLEAQLGL